VKRLLALCAGVAALWAGACSGGGTVVPPPPPVNQFSNSDLQGQYAFSMTGTDASTGTLVPFVRVGSFIADGKGGISGGNEDINIPGVLNNELSFLPGGTYTVNGNGRGTMSLIDTTGTLTFSITLTSPTAGYIVDMPTDFSSAGNGSFVKQTMTAFQLSGFSGNYAFDLSGVDPTAAPESVVGQLISNGSGTLSGSVDDNDAGVINGGVAGAAIISGSYAAPSLSPNDLPNFGRGVFAIGGITGVFYIVGPNQVKLMETTSGGTLAGDAFSQSNIPTTAAGISGGFVYVMGGSGSSASPLTRGGRFSASGGALSSILVDNNNAGQAISLSASSGTYTIDPSGNGRGTITYNVSGQKNTFSYVFYLISPTQAYVQDQSIGIVADGSMLAQGSGTISNSSLGGSYAINWSGLTSTGSGLGEEDLVGATTLTTGVLAGTIDLNEFASGKQGTGVPLTGTLALTGDGTGHNTLTVNLASNPANNGITAFAYVAANNTVLIMSTQTVRVVAGVLTPQAP